MPAYGTENRRIDSKFISIEVCRISVNAAAICCQYKKYYYMEKFYTFIIITRLQIGRCFFRFPPSFFAASIIPNSLQTAD